MSGAGRQKGAPKGPNLLERTVYRRLPIVREHIEMDYLHFLGGPDGFLHSGILSPVCSRKCINLDQMKHASPYQEQ